MHYDQAIDYLYGTLPMFTRDGAKAIQKGLKNTLAFCEALGNPQTKFRTIHIAGTNGKGSSSHLLASILQEAGYRTGLYTSPHLKSFTERIRLNGAEIPPDDIAFFVTTYQSLIEEIKPSFFETTVAMCFWYFAKYGVDIAIIETGLGGRLDSTNVILPDISLVTNIGWDHMDLLGNTLPEIAAEKAGIIKPGVPVVISEYQPEVANVFLQAAKKNHSDIYFCDDISVEYLGNNPVLTTNVYVNNHLYLDNLECGLLGHYQLKNLKGVVKTTLLLQQKGDQIEKSAIRNGIKKVIGNTGLKGRWQVLSEKPLVICDTGHNVDGIRTVVQQLKQTPHKKLFMVLGMVKDKDITAVLSVLPLDAWYYFCQANIPRAMDADTLYQMATTFGLKGEVVKDVNMARKKALEIAGKDDLIFVGGSTFVVAELDDVSMSPN